MSDKNKAIVKQRNASVVAPSVAPNKGNEGFGMSEANGECLPLSGSAFPPVLDACCGSRMFWFDRKDPRCLYVDKRRERHLVADCSVKNGVREIVVDPDVQADFTDLPFPDDTFAHVVFDPPHIQRNGDTSWLRKKYGVLRGEWRSMIRAGFAECFRVLRPEGVLVFKWNEIEVPLREILALTSVRPLYGHRTGKQAKTHWVAFLKPNKRSKGVKVCASSST